MCLVQQNTRPAPDSSGNACIAVDSRGMPINKRYAGRPVFGWLLVKDVLLKSNGSCLQATEIIVAAFVPVIAGFAVAEENAADAFQVFHAVLNGND